MFTPLKNIWYFGTRFLGYGLIFGFAFGSFTYPVAGTMVGTVWGSIAGLAMGLVTGIGVTIYDRFFVKPETDFATYQRNLSYGVGMGTLVVMALPLLIVYAPIAALTAAFVAHTYARTYLPQEEKRKNEDRQTLRTGVVARVIKNTVSKSPIFVGLAAVGVAFLRWWDMTYNWWYNVPTATEVWTQTLIAGLVVIVYGFVLAAVIGLVNGLFIHFMNHLHFTPNTSKDTYKRQLVPMVTLLTLIMTIVAAGFVGAPLAAIAAGWGASKYVDWYYDGQEKPKRAAQYNRLADSIEHQQVADEVEEDEAYLWHEGD